MGRGLGGLEEVACWGGGSWSYGRGVPLPSSSGPGINFTLTSVGWERRRQREENQDMQAANPQAFGSAKI